MIDPQQVTFLASESRSEVSGVATAYDLAGGLPLLAGGKSMGGRAGDRKTTLSTN